MQSCLRSLTSRRSHLGLAFRGSSPLVSSRRFARMPAVQARAVQTEAAPAQKTGLRSLEVRHTVHSRQQCLTVYYIAHQLWTCVPYVALLTFASRENFAKSHFFLQSCVHPVVGLLLKGYLCPQDLQLESTFTAELPGDPNTKNRRRQVKHLWTQGWYTYARKADPQIAACRACTLLVML